MLKKIAYAAIASGLLFAPMGASAMLSLPSGGVATMSDIDSPFPKDNSTDHRVDSRVHVAMPATTDSPFPKDNSTDHRVDSRVHVAMPATTDSPFPQDNSTDYRVDFGTHVAAI